MNETEIDARQAADWKKFVRENHDQGRCEFSGKQALACFRSICDCIETEEGARLIEKGECRCHMCKEEVST